MRDLIRHVKERQCCDAVARVLEARSATLRTNERCPERDRIGPPVDYIFDLYNKIFAFEHTLIESFERQIHVGSDFNNFINPIERRLKGNMHCPGVYELSFTDDPCTNLSRSKLMHAQELIIRWVLATGKEISRDAPLLKDRYNQPFGFNHKYETTINGIHIILA